MLVVVIMNFDGDGIDEYDELVASHDGLNFSLRRPKKAVFGFEESRHSTYKTIY